MTSKIPLVTNSDSDAQARQAIQQLYTLTGLNGFTARITMNPADIVAAYMPTAGSKPIPGVWFPLRLELPPNHGGSFSCNCTSSLATGSFPDCKDVCDQMHKAFNDINVGGVPSFRRCQRDARIDVASLFAHSTCGRAGAAGGAPSRDVCVDRRSSTSASVPKLGFAPGKDFHFGHMFDVTAVPGGALRVSSATVGNLSVQRRVGRPLRS